MHTHPQTCLSTGRLKHTPECPGGGIGRHAGLKILFLRGSAGSIPAPGTKGLQKRPFFNMFYLYILYSQQFDRYYIGQSSDIDARLERHQKGYVKSTKAYRPWKLVYSESFHTRIEAVNRETYLKSLKSKIKIKELVDTSR